MRRAARASKGYTLIEVVVSILLTAVMVSAVMSLAISSQQGQGKMDRRTEAAQCQRHLADLLAQYNSDTTQGTQIAGPSSAAPGPASWNLNGAAVGEGGQVVTDSCNCYALAVNTTHNLQNFCAAWFEYPPFNGRASYTVAATGGGGFDAGTSYATGMLMTSGAGAPAPKVNITVNWTEP